MNHSPPEQEEIWATQALVSQIPEGEDRDITTTSHDIWAYESEEKTIAEVFDSPEVGATDEWLAKGYVKVASKAKKPVSLWGGAYEMVPDWGVRRQAFHDIARMKNHFTEKARKPKGFKGMVVVLGK